LFEGFFQSTRANVVRWQILDTMQCSLLGGSNLAITYGVAVHLGTLLPQDLKVCQLSLLCGLICGRLNWLQCGTCQSVGMGSWVLTWTETGIGVNVPHCRRIRSQFLRTKAATASVHLSHRNLSICSSHGWISQKWCKLGSPNLHHRLPGRV